ncbi:MAG: aldehyde ferredoxin oxidoreductase family protein [Planctomycetes bacterium]|nr:aldehyde ferredoxin oxidoreductase family protein [Planctomycetota bacterium]
MSDAILEGYNGQYLEVDLSTGDVRKRPLDPKLAEDYLGGRGLATRVFYDEIDPTCDPLGPANVLVLAVSPLLGTNAPTSCRGHLVFKSPLTGVIGSSNCGGTWAPAFKSTGYDLIVIKGAAREPVLVDITAEQVRILPAGHLWGLDVHETTDRLLAERAEDRRARVLCIGPAGENLVRFAAVMNDKNRAYGRGGPGAVFGSKKLKAIRVSGRMKQETADPQRYQAGNEQARYLIKAVPTTKRLLRDMGTAGLVRLIDLIDMLPHRNFQDNLHPAGALEAACGEALRNSYLVRPGACGMCPLACQRHTRVGQRVGEGPEYETLALLGPNCAIYNLEAVTLANYQCNELGLDTISCGVTIGCAMELFEKGYITDAAAGGLDLRFGNDGILEGLVRQIAQREGLGDILAEGSLRLARHFQHPELSMSVKGLELPAYDPRASYTQALGYMTSPTGACHLRGGYAVSLAFFGGAKEIPRFSLLQSPIAIRNMQNLGIIQDSLGICRFTGYAFGTEPWSRMVSGVTGLDFSTARLEHTADRIAALERLFNLEAGAQPEDDTLPERFSTEPIAVAGQERVVSKELITRLRNDYYELQRWDREGRPTDELCRALRIESRAV